MDDIKDDLILENDDVNIEGCKGLVGAILTQALRDAFGKCSPKEQASARHFINKDNKAFEFYCGLLGWDAEYVAKKFKERIKEHDNAVSFLRFPSQRGSGYSARRSQSRD